MNHLRLFAWLFLLAVLVGPAAYLFLHPTATVPPFGAVLLDVLLFLLAWWLSREMARDDAELHANDKWVPQSRQACRSLLTVWADVQGLRHDLATMCSTLTNELPEMQDERMRGARAVLSGQCKSTASRLDTIANHLSDAVAAWDTSITANCQGMECAQIKQDMKDHREELVAQLIRLQQSGECQVPAALSFIKTKQLPAADPAPSPQAT
jgi:hypothetical protein